MLQAIHDKAKGWVAYLIIGFICIPFALWGVNSYFEGGGAVAAATVNGEEISANEVQNQLSQIRRQFGVVSAQMDNDQLREMAIESLVSRELMRQKVEEYGYRASGQEVADTISGYPVFQKDGRFDVAQYQSFLQTQRRSPAEFEEQIREDISQRQFTDALRTTAFVPESLAKRYQALREQKRDVELFRLKSADFLTDLDVSDEQIAEYYEANGSRFMTEDKVKLAYIEIDQEKVAEGLEATEEDLQNYYESNADRYRSPESRDVSHILVAVKSPAEDEQAKEKAQALYDAIQSGERSFEEVAREDSDDKLAAEKDGSMGEVVIGDWDPEFEKVVFSLEPNTISEPSKTEAGYEIIRVNSIKPAVQQSFADARSQVDLDYRQATADRLYLDKVDEVQTVAFEQSGDLAPAATAAGLEVLQSDWITRSAGEGIGNERKVRDAAFSDEVRSEGQNSEVIEITPTKAVVIRVTEQEAAKQQPLEEVKEQIAEILKQEEARKLVAEKGAALQEQLQKDNDWVNALAALELAENDEAVEKTGPIERRGSSVEPEVISTLFALSRPEKDQIVWGGVALDNGDYVVMGLKSVEDGEETLEDVDKQRLSNILGSRETGAGLKSLREKADVEVLDGSGS